VGYVITVLWSGNDSRYWMWLLFYDQEIAAGIGCDYCCFVFRKWQQIWDAIAVLWSGNCSRYRMWLLLFCVQEIWQQIWDVSAVYDQEMICLEAGCTVRTTTIAHSGWVQQVRTGLGYIEICRNN